MSVITFDTLAFAEELKAAGVPELQAKAHTQALVAAFEAKDLATKRDLAELELRLIKWIVGIAGGQAALIVALLKLLSD